MTATGEKYDRCRLPASFWQSLEHLGLRPSIVLRQARLPATLHLDETATISTEQLFAIWDAIEALSGDPAFAIRMVCETSTARHMLAFLAASYAADFRDALARFVRFKRLCSPDRISFAEQNGKVAVTSQWPTGTAPEPYQSVEASFALLLELGRRGTGERLVPLAVELRRPDQRSGVHAAFFGCAIQFGAQCDRMVLDTGDLDRPFPGHNPELLQMLTPALSAATQEIEASATLGEQIKTTLKRIMASGRPEVSRVARELGMSERTLQRRITARGQTFRTLLTEARQELGRQLLADPSIALEEVAYLLGYQDTNSFYRAFREWEEVTPNHWRRANAKDATPFVKPALT